MIMPLNLLRKYVERINSMLPSSERVEAALSQMGWSKHDDGVYGKIEWSTLAVVGCVGLEYNPRDNAISLHHGEPSEYPCICPVTTRMIKNSRLELFRLKRAVGD